MQTALGKIEESENINFRLLINKIIIKYHYPLKSVFLKNDNKFLGIETPNFILDLKASQGYIFISMKKRLFSNF